MTIWSLVMSKLGLCQCVAMLTRHSEQPDLWCAASPPLSLTISAPAQARPGLCLKPAQYRPIRTKWWLRLSNQSPEYWGQLRPPNITAPSQSPAPSTAGRLANQSKTDWELCQPLIEQCLWSCDWVVADWDGSQSVYTSDSRAKLEVTRSQLSKWHCYHISSIKHETFKHGFEDIDSSHSLC